jgi:hypothetical protein
MNKEFIPYELALELKRLGFDKPCFGVYFNSTQELFIGKKVNQYTEDVRTSAPTFSQAFRWFRDNYYLNAQIAFCEYSISSENSWKYTLDNPTEVQIWNGKFNTYEEAELACLIELITMEKETFESYLQRLKDRRTEDGYKYTDEDFEKYKEYVKHCYKTNLSVYKCLEFFYDEINNK